MSGAIKRCPQCGAACIYTDAFCVVCGHAFEDQPQAQEREALFAVQSEEEAPRQAAGTEAQGGRAPLHERHKARMAAGQGKKRRSRVSTRSFIFVVAAILVIGLYAAMTGGGAGLFPARAPAEESVPQGIPGPMPALLAPVEQAAAVPDGFTPITTVGELRAINDDLTGSYILMQDLHLGGGPGAEWAPIGAEEGKYYASLSEYGGFTGVFEGNGHTITGLYLTMPELQPPHVAAMGLFAMVMDGTVRNLSVQGEVLLAGKRGTYTYAGGIAGVQMGNFGEACIQNCAFTGRVGGATYNGGIVGMQMAYREGASASITHCVSAGAVSGRMAGGIAGCQIAAAPNSGALVQYSCNAGPVKASGGTDNEAGGIVGIMQAGGAGALARIVACGNTGEISGVNHTGGVVGGAVAASGGSGNARLEIYACCNTAPAEGKRMAGGIAGYTFVESPADFIQITSCYNTGRIKGAFRTRAAIAPTGTREEEKSAQLEDCYYTPASSCGDSGAQQASEADIGAALAGKGAYLPDGGGLPVLQMPPMQND